MTMPSVQVNALNRQQSKPDEVERIALFVGVGTKNLNTLITLSNDSDLDEVLGYTSSELKRQINAAKTNAGQGWFAYVYPMSADSYDFAQAVRLANEIASFEYAVNTETADLTSDKLSNLQTLHTEILGKYARRQFFIQAVAGLDDSQETWADYLAKLEGLTENVVADHVMVVPNLFGNDVGVLAGRLANRTVTVADTPARVKTGAVQDLGKVEKPLDMDGVRLNLSHLQALDLARYSTVMWYPDKEGYYWADGLTLDSDTGDYKVIENVRVVDKAARLIRQLAITKIGDRSLNSTLASIEAHKTYFTAPLREMATSATINGEVFPGECVTPDDESIEIVWHSKNEVYIYISVQPLDCPKRITVNVMLDLSLQN